MNLDTLLVTPDRYGEDGHYGWVPPDMRTSDVIQACERIDDLLPTFLIAGATESSDGKKVLLWDCTKKLNGGRHIPTLRQLIGSCVGHGLANAIRYLQAADIVIRKEFSEQWEEIFEPYGYGRSRYHSGMRGRGSGSTGTGAAKAAQQDGTLSIKTEGLSGWSLSGDTLTWSADADTTWSDGARIGENWIVKGRAHLVRTVARVRSYAEIRDAITNGYPVTIASGYGFRMSRDGDRIWGRRSGSWAHQMCFVGVDDDSRRPGCFCQNSWGADAHGAPTNGDPPGGFWVDAENVDGMARDEGYAFSQHDGFPAQKLDTLLI